MPRAKDEQRIKALQLLASGATPEEVCAMTKLPLSVIQKQIGWLRSPFGQMWIKTQAQKTKVPVTAAPPSQLDPPESMQGLGEQAHTGDVAGTIPISQPSQQVQQRNDGSRQTFLNPKEPGIQLEISEEGLQETVEKQLQIAASPIVRKIILNPIVYFWYDYAKTKLGFNGDIGDFLWDCVEDFFDARGVHIVVEQKRVTPVT